MKKSGFVLMETIVVISVLCVVLIALYASYNRVIVGVNTKSLYNNTEYIYKSNVIRNYLEPKINLLEYMGSEYLKVYCSDLELYNNCNNPSIDGYDIFDYLNIKAIYFTLWDVSGLGVSKFANLEPTTQKYINTLDTVKNDGVYRMIVMYEKVNSDDEIEYEYATLRFGSRG